MNQPVVQFKPKTETPAVAAETPALTPRKRDWRAVARASVIVAAIGLAVAIPLGWNSLSGARMQADATPVSAEVEGRVTRLLVADLQKVKKGDLLLQIDATGYQAQVQQAEAAVLAAEAQIYSIESQILLQLRVVDRAMAGLAALEADRAGLSGAEITRADAQIAEKQAEIAAERERINVLSLQAQQANAELSGKRAGLDLAMIELERTNVTAPRDGIVDASAVREGQFVGAGSPVLSVTPSVREI